MQKGWAVCWCERLVIEPGSRDEPCCRGAVHDCASPSASERIQDWVLGGRAADTDRRSFGAKGSTRHEASSTPQVQSPQERGAQQRRASVRGLPTRARGHVRSTQEVETATGRVRQAAHPLADATRMCATKSNTHPERGRRGKKRQKSAQKGLTIAAT